MAKAGSRGGRTHTDLSNAVVLKQTQRDRSLKEKA